VRIGGLGAGVELKIRQCWSPILTGTVTSVALLVALSAGVRNAINGIEYRKRSSARAQLSELRTMLERYHSDNGYYPTTNQGLDAVMNYDRIDPGMIRPPEPAAYAPYDPWGHPFVYESDGDSYCLSSFGPGGTGPDPDLTITVGP
jgi:general secretion pathway protein G